MAEYAFKVHLLPESEMRKSGFTDCIPTRWYYFKMLIERCEISFNISIDKADPEKFKIDVIDEDFLQPYDYQYILTQSPDAEVAGQIDALVRQEMLRLQKIGIISGYTPGDYI